MPRVRSPLAALQSLKRLRLTFGGDAGAQRLASLTALERARLPRAEDVAALHEALCFARAYPDDERVLAKAESLLGNFERRSDLTRHREALANSGIAGTEIRFRFFAETAKWLIERWPARLRIDWAAFEDQALLEALLPLLATAAESPGLDEYDYGLRGWIARLKGGDETDAAFLIRTLARLVPDAFLHEKLADAIDAPFRLSPARHTPSRTLAFAPRAPRAFVRKPLAGGRPDLGREIGRAARSLRVLDEREARAMIDLALSAMVTRSRDLDVFAYGDPRDVRMADCGDGLSFAVIGVRPERRLLLEGVYGYLTLKNGVPVGYVLASALYGSSEIAYNVFETFRGAEAAMIYARVLALTRQLFGSDTFTIYPYQLGDGNDEALDSGAWWFYRKLGFAPADAAARRIMRAEERRMRANPKHRSSRKTLGRLARHNLYWSKGAARADVIGRLPLSRAGLAVTRALGRKFGSDRAAGELACLARTLERFGLSRAPRRPAAESAAFERMSPLLAILPGVESWSASERRALLGVVFAKGGRRESDFVRAFDRHRKLRQALRTLVQRTPE
ncbi:MAG: hypothetical protein ACRENS_00195 [Candidatus Eiseniibacteriota bacterium]